MSGNNPYDDQDAGNSDEHSTPGSMGHESTYHQTPIINGLEEPLIDPYRSYGSVTGEDNIEYLACLAAAMGLTTGDIHELTVVANETGMGLAELLVILAEVIDLFTVIATPVLPSIDVIVIEGNTDDGADPQSIIDEMNAVASGIPPLISGGYSGYYRIAYNILSRPGYDPFDNANGPVFPLPLPPISSGRSGLSEIADKVAERHPFDELAARRRAQRTRRFNDMAAGRDYRTRDNLTGLNRTPFDPTSAHYFHGMVRRSMLFMQLIALGNMIPDVDADPEDVARAERNRDMLTAWSAGFRRAEADMEPYTEDADPTDPAS